MPGRPASLRAAGATSASSSSNTRRRKALLAQRCRRPSRMAGMSSRDLAPVWMFSIGTAPVSSWAEWAKRIAFSSKIAAKRGVSPHFGGKSALPPNSSPPPLAAKQLFSISNDITFWFSGKH